MVTKQRYIIRLVRNIPAVPLHSSMPLKLTPKIWASNTQLLSSFISIAEIFYINSHIWLVYMVRGYVYGSSSSRFMVNFLSCYSSISFQQLLIKKNNEHLLKLNLVECTNHAIYATMNVPRDRLYSLPCAALMWTSFRDAYCE
jgi:hypothetical protein